MVAGSDLYHLGIYAICNCYKDFRINANLQIIYHFRSVYALRVCPA